MHPKINSDQNSIFSAHLTSNASDLNLPFQSELSDIIEEQTLPEYPRPSHSVKLQKQRKVLNNSLEITKGISSIDILSDQDAELIKDKYLGLSEQKKKQQNPRSIQQLTMTQTDLSFKIDQDKSLFGLTVFTEEQPLQNQQQSAQYVQNRRSSNISQIQQESKNAPNFTQIGRRCYSKENNSVFTKQLAASIQMAINDNQSQYSQNNNQINPVNNKLNNTKLQPQKENKLQKALKLLVNKNKFGTIKQNEQDVEQNHAEQLKHKSSFMKLKSKIQNIVIKAVQKWKEYSSTWVYSQLNESAIKIIGDKSHITANQSRDSEKLMASSFLPSKSRIIQQKMIFLYERNKIKMRSFIYRIIKQWKAIKTIEPSSTILLYWDILHIIFIIFNIYYIIIEWVTEINFTSYYGLPWIISIIVSLAIFGIDIILNFHKGFYHEGVCIYDKYKIATFYITKNFFFDVCAIVPLVISMNQIKGHLKILTILILFKIQSAVYILSKYKDLYSTRSASSFAPPLLNLLKLGLTILFVAHIFASFFLGLAIYIQNSMTQYPTWLQQRQLLQESWLVQYLFSLHWAVCTMTTVGYGDITPQNPFEAGYFIITMFIACGFFAYTFNSIGSMVQEIQNRNREFNDSNDISNDLKLRIRKYFEFQRSSKAVVSKKEENEIIESLDDDLKDLVLEEIGIQNYKKIKEITKIFEPFSEKVKNKLHEISDEIVIKGEEQKYYIVQANQIQEFYDLYIIISGKARVYMKNDTEERSNILQSGINDMLKSEVLYFDKKNSKQKLKQIVNPLYILENKSIFGEQSFFSNQQRQFSIKCDKNTKLLRISQKLFIELIKENPNDFELFCQIRDNMILNQDTQFIETSCLACNKKTHDITKCKYIHYNIDKQNFVQKKLLLDKYEEQNQLQNPILFERKRFLKFKYSKFMKYNNALQERSQGTQTPQTKKSSSFRSSSFRSFTNITTTVLGNQEDKNDQREQFNLEESDQISEFKYYFPEYNISCVIWKQTLQDLKRLKRMEQFMNQSYLSDIYKQENFKFINNSLYKPQSKQKIPLLNSINNKNNNRISQNNHMLTADNQMYGKLGSAKEIKSYQNSNQKIN